MIEVVWSETAIQTYLRIVDYLFIEWTRKEINEFEKDVESLLAKISENICCVNHQKSLRIENVL